MQAPGFFVKSSFGEEDACCTPAALLTGASIWAFLASPQSLPCVPLGLALGHGLAFVVELLPAPASKFALYRQAVLWFFPAIGGGRSTCAVQPRRDHEERSLAPPSDRHMRRCPRPALFLGFRRNPDGFLPQGPRQCFPSSV